MIKYLNYSVTFQEVPNETSLCFNITNCQNRCEGCHSPELREDIGKNLEDDMADIIGKYEDGITCVCFLGEGNDPVAMTICLNTIRVLFPKLKICLYSGDSQGGNWNIYIWLSCHLLDYLKLGPYIEDRGPLNNPNTNQRMYKVHNDSNPVHLEDITKEFWKKKV